MSSNLVDAGKMAESKPKKKRRWIKAAVPESHKGLLHEHLGVKQGEKIPEHRLREAANSKDEKIRKEAQFALNMEGLKHKKKKAMSAEETMQKRYGK